MIAYGMAKNLRGTYCRHDIHHVHNCPRERRWHWKQWRHRARQEAKRALGTEA